MKSIVILFVLTLFTCQSLIAQENIKFGKVSKASLEEKFYPEDSSANAAILYKKRRTHYEYSDDGGWRLVTKIHERIKIYNKQGNDWATKSIRLYSDGNSENASVKANTYNLNNGKIEKIKLKKSDVFIENVNKYWNVKKFTMPNLKEGSIVEWEYTINSPYAFNINDMIFQYKIPLKHIDSEIRIPEFFVFKYRPSTYYPIAIEKSTKNRGLNYSYRTKDGSNGFGGGVKTKLNNTTANFQEQIFSSVQSNIPAIKEEPFINNLDNYISKTSFEYTAYKPRNGTHKYYNTTWDDVTKTIYKSSNFGEQIKKRSHFKDDLQNILSNVASNDEKIIKIFEFVKGKIKWNNFRGKYTDDGVKKAYTDGVGNVAEINLTLVSMLKEAGFNANPILVSTRDNGIPLFPTSAGFNYVIAGIELNSGLMVLDATEKYSLPNVLPLRALNWQGRVVRNDESSSAVNLFSPNTSSKKVYLNAKMDDEGSISGMSRIMYNNLIALTNRNANNDVTNQDLIGKLEKNNDDIEILNLKVINDKNLSKPLINTLSFETDSQTEMIGDKMYFSPLLYLAEKENPFKLDERIYPIDFGTPWEEKYTVNIQIPQGYSIESKPENAAYALPDNLGIYKFVCVEKNNKLQILSTVNIKQSILPAHYYNSIREFYKKMIDKQTEKIVLTKI